MFYNYIFQHKNEQLTGIIHIFVKNNNYEHINNHSYCSLIRCISDKCVTPDELYRAEKIEAQNE